MAGSITYLSLAAIGLYALVSLACMAACGTAAKLGQATWNRNAWLGLAALFVVLIALRGLGVEDMIRDAMRTELRSDGSYDTRRFGQGIVVSIVLAVVSVAGMFWGYRLSRRSRGRRNQTTLAALAAGGVMVFLVVLRVISLHMIDRLLFGPLKLNWIGDIGASLVVLGAAIYYMKLVRERP